MWRFKYGTLVGRAAAAKCSATTFTVPARILVALPQALFGCSRERVPCRHGFCRQISLSHSLSRASSRALSLGLPLLSLSRVRALSLLSLVLSHPRSRSLSLSLSRARALTRSPSARALVNSPSTTTLTRNPCRRLAGHPDMLRHHKYSVI
jgi:hypothetical protein